MKLQIKEKMADLIAQYIFKNLNIYFCCDSIEIHYKQAKLFRIILRQTTLGVIDIETYKYDIT